MTEVKSRAELIQRYLDLDPIEQRMVLVGTEMGLETGFRDVMIVSATRIEPLEMSLARFLDDCI